MLLWTEESARWRSGAGGPRGRVGGGAQRVRPRGRGVQRSGGALRSTREEQDLPGGGHAWAEPTHIQLATPTGLEPAASAVTGRRANQLRYGAWCCCRVNGGR